MVTAEFTMKAVIVTLAIIDDLSLIFRYGFYSCKEKGFQLRENTLRQEIIHIAPLQAKWRSLTTG